MSRYRIELRGYVPPTLNRMLRQHWSRRRTEGFRVAWLVRAALAESGQALPAQPLARARVMIERAAPGHAVDPDGLVGGCKGLLDVLQPATPKRRYGLGLIQDDSPRHIDLIVSQRSVPREEAGTTITIAEL